MKRFVKSVNVLLISVLSGLLVLGCFSMPKIQIPEAERASEEQLPSLILGAWDNQRIGGTNVFVEDGKALNVVPGKNAGEFSYFVDGNKYAEKSGGRTSYIEGMNIQIDTTGTTMILSGFNKLTKITSPFEGTWERIDDDGSIINYVFAGNTLTYYYNGVKQVTDSFKYTNTEITTTQPPETLSGKTPEGKEVTMTLGPRDIVYTYTLSGDELRMINKDSGFTFSMIKQNDPANDPALIGTWKFVRDSAGRVSDERIIFTPKKATFSTVLSGQKLEMEHIYRASDSMFYYPWKYWKNIDAGRLVYSYIIKGNELTLTDISNNEVSVYQKIE